MIMQKPCVADPVSFDQDHTTGIPHPPVDQLIQVCLIQCPFLDWCRSRDTSTVYGVVAGVYKPWPSDSFLPALNRSEQLRRVLAGLRVQVAALEPGEALPSCLQLSREYATSRPTMRAALRCLAEEDVLLEPTTRSEPYRVPPREVAA